MKKNRTSISSLCSVIPFRCFLSYFIILIFIVPITINAQQQLEPSPEIKYFDARYGNENQDIFNGIRFYDLYGSTPKNYRYFKSYQPEKGTVVYNGQTYYNINMHYDLADGNLIVFSDEKASFFQVILASDKVSSFTFSNIHFKREDLSLKYNKPKNSFYEVAYTGETLSLLISRSKKAEPKKRNDRVYYTFSNTHEFYIKKGDEFLSIDNIRDLKKYFPDQEREISQFYRAYKNLRRTDFKKFMQNLTKLLERLVTI